MPLPKTLCDREQAKFKTDSSGDTCVNVCGELDTLPKGATGPILITGGTITDTSAPFPATAQVGRVSLSIRNLDVSDSIFVVNSSGISKVTAGIDAWEIPPNETANYDLDDANNIFLVTESGISVSVQAQEIKA